MARLPGGGQRGGRGADPDGVGDWSRQQPFARYTAREEAGFLTDRRGGFFLIDIDAAEELYALFGPEVYGHFQVQALPVAPLEKGAELFQQWAQEGR